MPAQDITVVTDEADNCSTPVVAFVGDVSSGTCPEIITRTYSVTDDCGNSITVTQTITVNDDIAPTASNPAPLTVQCIGDVPPRILQSLLMKLITAQLLSLLLSVMYQVVLVLTIITRTYSVTDDCGNQSLVTQTITVDDDIDPTASNPAPLLFSVSVMCRPRILQLLLMKLITAQLLWLLLSVMYQAVLVQRSSQELIV